MGAGGSIAVVGTGRIASVLAPALTGAGYDVIVAGRHDAAARTLAATCPPARALPIPEAAASCSMLLLAVAPEAYLPLLAGVAGVLHPETIIISLTNGVPLATLGDATANPIVKLVPTLAQRVRRGALPVMAGPHATSADVAKVMAVAGRIGQPILIRDEDARVASNVAGSALALVARFGEALVTANASQARHLGRTELTAMIAETLGAVSELVAQGHGFDAIVACTATPGGVTAAQLAVLDSALPALAEQIVATSFARQKALQTVTQARLT